MSNCEYLNGIRCNAPTWASPTLAVELTVASEDDKETREDITACSAAGWASQRDNCSGNPASKNFVRQADIFVNDSV